MEIISLKNGVEAAISKATKVLQKGGVILYPTDTLYGLGADALSDEAVDKIFSIKGRSGTSPMSAIFADSKMLEEYTEINDGARSFIGAFLPGALTLVLKKKRDFGGVSRGIDTIGVRIPQNDFCLALAKSFGKPFVTTSANAAGLPPRLAVADILDQLGEKAAMIDLVIDGGQSTLGIPSSVVDVSSGKLQILRIGVITEERMRAALE